MASARLTLPISAASEALRNKIVGGKPNAKGKTVTIAICCVSPEGVVLGADSTASLMVQAGGFHYLNHNQKIFEVGSGSRLGLMTWGMASLGTLSHRTQIAQLGDSFAGQTPGSVLEACARWIDHFWPNFQTIGATEIARLKALDAKAPFDRNRCERPTFATRV